MKEIPGYIVCNHDYGPTHVDFDLIKIEENQQIIGNYKEYYPKKVNRN
jgi:hypothetical protein